MTWGSIFWVQAAFFIAYVVTSGWTSLSSELFRLVPLICSIFKRLFCGKDSDEFDIPSTPYHSEIPRVAFFGLLGVTYFFLAPLILPFLIIYYCMGYIIYRNQVSSMPISYYLHFCVKNILIWVFTKTSIESLWNCNLEVGSLNGPTRVSEL